MPSVRVKICGITRVEDALYVERLGAAAAGFIFHRKSPRWIEPGDAGGISAALGPFIARIGVFVDEDPDTVRKTFRTVGLTAVQLHGGEDPDYVHALGGIPVIKAFRTGPGFSPEELEGYRVAAFLVDAWDATRHGGTGRTCDWSIARICAERGRLILAGGITADNVADAVGEVSPWAVDVSSGVESSPGVKDHGRLRELFDVLRDIGTADRP